MRTGGPCAQTQNLVVVMRAIVGAREDAISGIVERLSLEACDTLMRYVYKGLGTRAEASGTLLKWHARIVERAGVGSIVRVITDRRTV